MLTLGITLSHRIAAVIEKLAERRRRARSSRLLAVRGVECLIDEQSEGCLQVCPCWCLHGVLQTLQTLTGWVAEKVKCESTKTVMRLTMRPMRVMRFGASHMGYSWTTASQNLECGIQLCSDCAPPATASNLFMHSSSSHEVSTAEYLCSPRRFNCAALSRQSLLK